MRIRRRIKMFRECCFDNGAKVRRVKLLHPDWPQIFSRNCSLTFFIALLGTKMSSFVTPQRQGCSISEHGLCKSSCPITIFPCSKTTIFPISCLLRLFHLQKANFILRQQDVEGIQENLTRLNPKRLPGLIPSMEMKLNKSV